MPSRADIEMTRVIVDQYLAGRAKRGAAVDK
jgi:hypothetical protein